MIVSHRWSTCPPVHQPGVIPDSVKSMTIITPVLPDAFHFPPQLAQLTIKGNTDRLAVGFVPDTVTHFQTTCSVGPRCLPLSISHLRLAEKVRMITPHVIPNSVTHLEIYKCIVQDGAIPDSVTHLVVGTELSHGISDATFPRHVTHLCLRGVFDQPLEPPLIPQSVVCLFLGNAFDQPLLPGDIPNSVKYLTFGSVFCQDIDRNNLPIELSYLGLPRRYIKWEPLARNLPPSVTHLRCRSDLLDPDPQIHDTYVDFWKSHSVPLAP